MIRETAQQRYRRQKRDKLRDAQIAPTYTVAPVRCGGCNHSELMHSDRRCLNYRCDCTEYREVV